MLLKLLCAQAHASRHTHIHTRTNTQAQHITNTRARSQLQQPLLTFSRSVAAHGDETQTLSHACHDLPLCQMCLCLCLCACDWCGRHETTCKAREVLSVFSHVTNKQCVSVTLTAHHASHNLTKTQVHATRVRTHTQSHTQSLSPLILPSLISAQP